MPRKYVIGLVAITLVFAVGLILIARSLMDDKPKPAQTQTQTSKPQTKDFRKDTNSVTYTTQGRIVGQEQYREIRITVTGSERKVEVVQGYNGSIIKSQSLSNQQNAYGVFLAALNSAGYTNINPQAKKDEVGTCANGRRFIYEIVFKDNSRHRAWNTTCTREGNFTGNASLVRSIFQNQIPDYQKFASDVKLN